MKTPMTHAEWWDALTNLEQQRLINITTRSATEHAFAAGQANAPQPQWRRWEDEKPCWDNELKATRILLEFEDKRIDCYSMSETLSNWNYAPIAWQYILPSGFAPKQKDEAEEEYIKFCKENHTFVAEADFKHIYNLFRAKAK